LDFRAAGATPVAGALGTRRRRAMLALRGLSEMGSRSEVCSVARSMWKGAIQFGLVTIPVKLYLATESKA